MAGCKIYPMLLALVICHVSANYERLENLSYFDVSRVPWKSNYRYPVSKLLPHNNNNNSYKSTEDQSRNYFGNLEHFFITNNTNKEFYKNRNFKRPASLFSIFTNDDFIKYKKSVLNPKAEYCRKIIIKPSAKEDELQKGITTNCYKCKNLQTKSTYERCLYNNNNHPEENISVQSTKVKRSSFAPNDFFRYRRSNIGKKNNSNHGKLQNPYRFANEYFSDAATYAAGLPAIIYESKEEKCDKIVKNSMICMVCKNAKTNSKYEQCSYVKQPYEKPQGRISDSKHLANSTFDFERNNENKDMGSNPITTKKRSRSRDHFYLNEDYLKPTFTTNEEQIEPRHFFQKEIQNTSSADCKEIEIDSKTCIICKDSKIDDGGTYEKCFYNYEPSKKLYKYHRSKSFEYPGEISAFNQDLNKSNQASNRLKKKKKLDYTQSPDDLMHRNAYSPEAKVANDSGVTPHISSDYGSDYSKESEELSNSNPESYKELIIPSAKRTSSSYSEHSFEDINVDNCKQFQKDSMTCTICKDGKTGNDFEHCSYSYQPNDKVFSYTKSSSFGNSRENDKPRDMPYEDEESKSSEILEESSYRYYIPRQTKYQVLTKAKPEYNVESNNKKIDNIYLDTKEEKTDASLQKFSIKEQPICKKIMRDKITCYQCSDKDGFQQEECFFVTLRNPEKNKFVFHERKEFQMNPALRNHGQHISLNNSTKTVAMNNNPVDPNASASRNSYVKLQKADNDYPDKVIDTTIEKETEQVEPYDYISETRSRYDTALGLTLPAYMLTNSEHEAAFDELVTSNYGQR